MAMHQAVKDASSRGLADGRRNSGNRGVSVEFDIHTFTVDELFVLVSWQSTGCVRCGGRLVEYFLPNLS